MPPSSSLLPKSPWRCPTCRHALRPFSTTRPSRAIGPEHPRYIDVPEAVQPNKVRLPRIRGSLPIPRDIFHHTRGGTKKVTAAYLKKTNPPSTKPKPSLANTSSPEAETEAARQAWKHRMTDRRRQNLREGLQQLQARRQRDEWLAEKRRAERARISREAAQAPPSEAERLTNPSVTLVMQPHRRRGYRVPDPNRQERIAAMRARVAAKEEEDKAARYGALRTLYMNARSFIVSETQLDAAIDQQFGTSEQPAMFGWKGTSILDVRQPQGLQDRLNAGTKAAKPKDTFDLEDTGTYAFRLANRRMKKIAEELGGAKT